MSTFSSRRRVALPLISAVVAALAFVLLPLSPASAAVSQGIGGHVTGPGGVALPDVAVAAFSQDPATGTWEEVNDAFTDASGDYAVDLEPGVYRLRFVDDSGNGYAFEWWNDASTLTAATPVTVTAGNLTPDVSPQLAAGGHIAGTVAGGSISGYVTAYAADATDPSGYAMVAYAGIDYTTGNYEVSGLPSGSYKLEFQGYGYDTEFYNDKASVEEADAVAVTAPSTTSSVNATLTPWANIRGTVTGPDGSPRSGVEVQLLKNYGSDGWQYTGDWEDFGAVMTGADGTYAVSAPHGTYRVSFQDDDPTLLDEFWHDKYRIDDAQDVVLVAGADTPNIDAQLDVGGHITGTVSQAIGVGGSVAAWVERHPGTGDWYPAVYARISKLDGTYHIDGLTTDHYKVHFSVKGFDGEWWHDQTILASATEIPVTAPATVSGISPTLTPHVHITGTITNPSHAPVADGYVSAFRFDGTRWVRAKTAGIRADGTYDLNVSAGTYRLRVNGWADADRLTPYATEFYDNAKTLESATSITAPVPGQIYSGKDVQLEDAAGLDGTLTFPSADQRGTKMDRVVAVYDKATGALVTTALARFSNSSDTTADWSIDDLAAGSYRVDFARISGPSLPDGFDETYSASFDRLSGPARMEGQYYDNQPESGGAGAASSVTIAGGEGSLFLDTTMHVGGVIHGKLVDDNGHGLAGCRVQATSAVANKLVTRSNLTASDGTFDVTGLSTGDYNLAVLDRGDCDHAEYYTDTNGDLSQSDAGPQAVSVKVGETTTMPAQLLYGGNLPVGSVSNVTAPTVPGGAPAVGTPVTANPGTWNPADATLAYQWKASGSPVGSDSPSYTPVATDVGKTLSVTVTASKPGYTSVSATSNSTAPVVAPAPPPPPPSDGGVLSVVVPPKLSGVLKVGKVLVAAPPSVTPAATSVAFRWLRNGVPIKGVAAKRARYKLVRADRHRRISVRITLTRPGYPPLVLVVKKAGRVK